MSTALTDNQVRGYKSTINNPRVSAEAKEHAQRVLARSAAPNRLGPRTDGEEFQNRHLGGKKATLKNPNTSEEAKQQAREELDNANYSIARDDDDDEEEIHLHRVLGGYKATLKNPNVSEEAKQHAKQVLEENDAL